MNKLIASLFFSALLAAPAMAQAPNPQKVFGSNAGVSAARAQVAPRSDRGVRQPVGQRWPGAKYDENGYYIDPNSPGRW